MSPDTVGQLLREAREARGATLEEAERATRIRARFLEALENEQFDALASPVQVRGFLRNYAQFLGLNAEQVLAHYEQARGKKLLGLLPAPPAPTPAYRPRVPQVRSRRPRWLSADILVAAVVTLGLAALLLWGGAQIAARLKSAPAAGPNLTATGAPAESPTPSEAGATPTEPLPTPQAAYLGVNVVIRAEQRVWLRVTVDGAEAFAGLLTPGTTKEFIGQRSVEVLTGNGKGTRVIWNGRDQGTLGDVGEVVDRLWTLEGMVIPTPTVTPTPTETEPPTATPRPSATPRP